MTIRKHGSWGVPGPLAPDGLVVHDDVAMADAIALARARGDAMPEFGLLAGDLCRTLGGPGDAARLFSNDAHRFPIDLGVAVLDGVAHVFVAHAIARRTWWHGRVVAIMNAQLRGNWDLGPKSHPNDGLLDISDGDISLADRWKALRRLPSGSHLPHPGITTSRRAAADFHFAPALDVWLDGRRHRRVTDLVVRTEPDAFTVVV